ncbi:divalent metal cation transporter [Ginsengibacter hankyongi]|uniref:Divalent metal cation transporter n=1 Tax=Ginsengibacter hankyongi TaxID=2607284 RepID=A0A5J5IIQ8_9BACT|nr:divalent metal cation transporter [Ginsengibacter hankyongi]KAA9038119.1 divalent metal cation transporter [Ginsengibacter hankyongi]
MNRHKLHPSQLRKFWKALGPGLISGASDDDPSAITTFSQAGARFGLSTLWVAILSFPVLATIQEMCARIGMVTKKGIAGVVKAHYPKWVLYVLIGLSCPAFLLNMGADISVLGETGNLLFPHIAPLYWSIAFTLLLLLLMIVLSFQRLARVMKFVCLSLVVYVVAPFFYHQDLSSILKHSFIPSFHFNKTYILLITGLTGAIISPYLFFWQTSSEAEEDRVADINKPVKRKFFRAMRIDIITGAFFAVLIMYFVILTTGTVLHNNDIYEINTVAEAAVALKPLAGNVAYILFSIGVISTAFLIIPVLSGSVSYILSEAFNWKSGFNKSFGEAKEFYIIIIVAMCLGIIMQLLRINAIKALLFTTVIYGIIAPFLIGIIMHICNNKKIMGQHINKITSNLIGMVTLLLMLGVLIVLGYFLFIL